MSPEYSTHESGLGIFIIAFLSDNFVKKNEENKKIYMTLRGNEPGPPHYKASLLTITPAAVVSKRNRFLIYMLIYAKDLYIFLNTNIYVLSG